MFLIDNDSKIVIFNRLYCVFFIAFIYIVYEENSVAASNDFNLSKHYQSGLLVEHGYLSAKYYNTRKNDKNVSQKESGPSKETIDIVSSMAQIAGVEEDFSKAIGWSSKLYRDNKYPSKFYFLPKEYLIKRNEDPAVGYEMKFTYGHSTDNKEAMVSFNAILSPSNRKGDLKLLRELIKAATKSRAPNIKVSPLPMLETSVIFSDLKRAFKIDEKDMYITNPQNVSEPVTLVIRMKESVQSEFVTYLRDNGLSGRFIIKEKNIGTIEIPITMNFRNYSGPKVSFFGDIISGRPLRNLSSFPVKVKGFTAYSLVGRRAIRRQYFPFKSVSKIPPGGSRRLPNLKKLIKGKYVHAWFNVSLDASCKSCVDSVEKRILASATKLRKNEFELAAMPSLFEKHNVYKIVLEIESNYFDLSNTRQIQTFILRSEKPLIYVPLYIDPSVADGSRKVKYRYKYIKQDDITINKFSNWLYTDSLELTIAPGHLQLN